MLVTSPQPAAEVRAPHLPRLRLGRHLLHLSGRAGPAPASARRITLDELAGQAASEAATAAVEALDVGPESDRYRGLFPADRYDSIAVAPPAPPLGLRFGSGWPMRSLPVSTARFGVVLCAGVLEQASEPRGVMMELSRALEPNGRLFLAAPLIVPDPTVGPAAGRQRFGLNYLLSASGFSILDLAPIVRSSTYGIIARKTARYTHARRAADVADVADRRPARPRT